MEGDKAVTSPHKEAIVRGRDLHVTLGGKDTQREILAGVDIDLHAGEVVGLIGPNGAGKSTLLGLLSGDMEPTAGTVEIAGSTYADLGDKVAARIRSVMMQDSRVSFSYTVRDVVTMGRTPWGRDVARDEPIIAGALREVGIEHLADRDVTTLSGGERARAALARVIAQDAQCVMLDEPIAAMDIGHSERTMLTVRRLAAQDRAVLVVIHDLATAARHCDRLVLLAGGGVHASGAPEEVCTAKNLSDVYGWPVDVSFHEGIPWIRPKSG